MTEIEKKYSNDMVFEKEFEELYAQVLKKYDTKKLRKYIHYKSTYNLYVGLKTPKIKRKSLNHRVLLIKYLQKITSENLFIEGETLHNELMSKKLFEKDIRKIAKFNQQYHNYKPIILLEACYSVLITLFFILGYYIIPWYGLFLGLLIGILCYFHFQKKKKQHKIYGFRY